MQPRDVDDFYGSPAFLRRWFMVDGEPCCPFDAVQPWAVEPEARDAIIAANAEVRGRLAAVVAYEDALAVVALPEPPAPTEDGAGAAEHEAWWDARFLVDTAADDTKHLRALRAKRWGQDVEVEPDVPAEPEPEDAIGKMPKVPHEIPVRAAEIVMSQAGYYEQLQALVAALPTAQRIEVERAATWKRDHPIILAAAAQMDPPLSVADINHLFRMAAKLG